MLWKQLYIKLYHERKIPTFKITVSQFKNEVKTK